MPPAKVKLVFQVTVLSALMDYDLFHQVKYYDRPHCAHTGPSLDIIELLLKIGVGPNQASSVVYKATKTQSPWKIVCMKRLNDKSPTWDRIYELFISYGAGDDARNDILKNETRKAMSENTVAKAEKLADRFGLDRLKKAMKKDSSLQDYQFSHSL